MPITNLLSRNALQFGNDVAIVEINPTIDNSRAVTWKEYDLIETCPEDTYRNEMTWRQFDEKANRFANLLISSGIRKGDKVGILLMNCIEWLPIYFGALKSGAIAVPLNYRYTSEEIKYCVELAEVDLLIFGPEFIGRIENIFEQFNRKIGLYFVGENCPTFANNYYKKSSRMPSVAPRVAISDEDDAAIYFSSGTTGFPKAILHAHKALMHSAIVENKHHGQTKDDVFLCIPPLYHTGAKMHWFGSLYAGGKTVLLKGVRPEWILKAVSDEGVTIVWLLVPWAQDILDSIERGEIDLKEYKLDQWRLMHIGAQPVPQSLITRWKKVFPNHQYDTNYGLSESIGPGCVHLGIENIHKVGAIGKAGYGWQTKIVDGNGEEVARGEAGELLVKGDGVMLCYYRDKEATENVLKNGWLFTGDVAMEDEDGFIYLVDRKKDVIIMGGENIYPVQIEDFLRSHPLISDVAVIGLPDSRLGEIVAAIIQVKEGKTLSIEEVDEFCKALPRYKRPKHVIFANVPRNPTGKIEKPKLREMYGAACLIKKQTDN